MSDDFEDLLKRWLRDRAGTDRSEIQALAGNVAALPPRRQRRLAPLMPLAAAIVVLIGFAVLASPRFGESGGEPSDTTAPSPGQVLPGGPGPYVELHDARLGQCFGSPDDMEYVFEMTHARDYQRYMPRMGRSPELDVDEAALVVVYRDGWAGPMITGTLGGEPQSPTPGRRFVCVLVASGDPIMYGNVDIEGLTIDVVPSDASPGASDDPSPPLPPVEPSFTPSPAPAWTAGAAAVLQCDGPPAEFGATWTRGSLYTTDRGTPELALEELAHRLNSYGQPFPTAALIEIGRDETAVAFAYHYRGGARAVAVIRSEASAVAIVWYIESVAVCDASEFGPDAKAAVHSDGWIDATGAAVPTTTLEEIPDCYFGWKLTLDGRLFVWAPINADFEAFSPEWLEAEIDMLPALPDGAIDTGYRSNGRQLFLAPDGKAAFVVLLDGVQRWAHVIGDDYQRTDCN
jgi:hypothetical protein